MKLAVLSSPRSWYLQDLVRAARRRHDIQAIPFTQLSARLTAQDRRLTWTSVGLTDFDAVMVRTMPPGSLEQVVFRMDLLGQLEARGTPVVNPPRAIEAAVDKYLALARLERVGISIPPTIVSQTVEDAMAAFEDLGGDVVIKPLFGGEGRGLVRVSNAALAWRTFQALAQTNSVLYLQQFIPHAGFDLRLFVLGDDVFAMRRSHPRDWRTNISLGATASRHEPDDDQVKLALIAAKTIGTSMAGVDLLPGKDGNQYVLEVNAVPGWKALAEALEVDIAQRVLDFLVRHVRETRER